MCRRSSATRCFCGDGPGDSPRGFIGPRKLHVAAVAVGASCGVALRVGLRPGELLDLLCGFVGLDVAGDDRFGEPATDQKANEPPKLQPLTSSPIITAPDNVSSVVPPTVTGMATPAPISK